MISRRAGGKGLGERAAGESGEQFLHFPERARGGGEAPAAAGGLAVRIGRVGLEERQRIRQPRGQVLAVTLVQGPKHVAAPPGIDSGGEPAFHFRHPEELEQVRVGGLLQQRRQEPEQVAEPRRIRRPSGSKAGTPRWREVGCEEGRQGRVGDSDGHGVPGIGEAGNFPGDPLEEIVGAGYYLGGGLEVGDVDPVRCSRIRAGADPRDRRRGPAFPAHR